MQIRRARTDDIPDIITMQQEGWFEDYAGYIPATYAADQHVLYADPDTIRRHIADYDVYSVVEDDGAKPRSCPEVRVPIEISVTINRDPVSARVTDQQLLCDFLRDERGLLGTRVGCNEGVCGSCTVLVDGEQVRSCLMLAAQVDGCEVLTVEGLATGPGGRDLHPLQRAFIEHGAIQCGFCTAGLLMASKALLDANPQPTETEILEGLAGNLCRCTGYVKVAEAVAAAAHMLAANDRKHGTPGANSRAQERAG